MQTQPSKKILFYASSLVAGNVLGVGVLALPIKSGIAGFFPALLSTVFVWLLMLVSAFVIVEKLPTENKHFDIPSFFNAQLGKIGYWVAIICNLIILYGVIVAYLSGMTCLISSLVPPNFAGQWITLIYFLFVSSILICKLRYLTKSNIVLILAIFICFLLLVFSSTSHFNTHLLLQTNWKLAPLGLAVAVSAFHFHNIIPTVSHTLNKDKTATKKAIFIGVLIGLIINTTWLCIVTGTLHEMSVDHLSIASTYAHNLPATIPMAILLHSRIFITASMTFGVLAITASYIANGRGLFGFIRDMTTKYFSMDNRFFVALIAFLPPLIVTLIYPSIFLYMLDIVGGIGETALFIILPAVILMRMLRKKTEFKYQLANLFAYLMFLAGCFIFIFIVLEKFGVIHLNILK